MKSTEYLYGVPAQKFSQLSYTEALHYRIKSAQTLVAELLAPPYNERDQVRLTDVLKAIKFNEDLLREMGVWN